MFDIPFITSLAYTKALPIWLAALMSWIGGRKENGRKSAVAFISSGLILSSMGDIALEWSDNDKLMGRDEKPYFLSGLICFLLAHCLYTQAFFPFFVSDSDGESPFRFHLSFEPVIAIPLICFYIVLMSILLTHNKETDLNLPVLIYGLIIVRMAYFCGWRWYLQSCETAKNDNHTNEQILSGYQISLAGCASFLVSDSILAIDKFAFQVKGGHGHTLVMITYYIAQYLIGYSVLFPLKKIKKD